VSHRLLWTIGAAISIQLYVGRPFSAATGQPYGGRPFRAATVRAQPPAADVEWTVNGGVDNIRACGGGKNGAPSGSAIVAFALPN